MTPTIQARLASFFVHDRADILAIYLFGSMARGEGTPTSDVDVAVLFTSMPEPTLAGPHLTLQAELEGVLHRRVDLVALNGASADLVHRVLRDGLLVVDRDPAARLRFEVAKRNEYFDLEPLRRQYRRQTPVRAPLVP